MRTDSRGRVRFTHRGVRYEINKYGVLRAYERNTKFDGSERAKIVDVNRLDYVGRQSLQRAIVQARGW